MRMGIGGRRIPAAGIRFVDKRKAAFISLTESDLALSVDEAAFLR